MSWIRKGVKRAGLVGLAVGSWLAAGCGDDAGTDPVDVPFGETTFVVVVNPTINDANQRPVPAPGSTREGVDVAVQSGPSATTDAAGVAVLPDLDAGTRLVSFDGPDGSGELALQIAERDLREVAVALTAGGPSVMANVAYPFSDRVIEVTPSMSVAEVNAALAESDVIVFFRSGTYTGDLDFSGSRATLFGEGPEGGNVTLDGDVTMSGSSSRIRGARITGDLSVPGSDAGVSFSSVAGSLTVDGSGATLLENAFCGPATLTGSGLLAVGNAGLAPIPAPAGGC